VTDDPKLNIIIAVLIYAGRIMSMMVSGFGCALSAAGAVGVFLRVPDTMGLVTTGMAMAIAGLGQKAGQTALESRTGGSDGNR